MVRKVLALLASLVLLTMSFVSVASPSFARTPDAYTTPASQGEVLGLADDIRNFVTRIWEATPMACLTNLDCIVRNFTVSIMNGFTMVLIGTPFTELTDQQVTAMRNGEWNVGLAFAGATAIDGAYIDPPGLSDLHLASYLRYELSDNLLSGRVYADTAGEQLLHPVIDIWNQVKEAAYGLFMMVMIVIGFMIMLRKQIAPRVVVSFTSALPKILASLILITFSFTLIALIFDVVGVFVSRILLVNLSGLPAGTIITAEGGIVGKILGAGAAQLLGESLATIFSVFDTTSASAWVSLQALFIFFIFLGFLTLAFFGVAAQLLFRIAKLLIKTILSPIIVLIGSLPGQEGTITNFAKGIITDCAAFPAIAFMFGVTRLFLRKATIGPPPLSEIESLGEIVPAVYEGVGLIFLTIVFMVMTMAAPMFVGKILTPSKK